MRASKSALTALTVSHGGAFGQRATLLLSLIYLQVLLGVIQLLLGFSSHDFAWRRMQRNSLTADHPVFASSALTGIAVHNPHPQGWPCRDAASVVPQQLTISD